MQDVRFKLRAALLKERDNGFRAPFKRGDAVCVVQKGSPHVGETGIVLRLEKRGVLGDQLAIVTDRTKTVITVPVLLAPNDNGISKFGAVEIPGLWIEVRCCSCHVATCAFPTVMRVRACGCITETSHNAVGEQQAAYA
jgi:hypothetical protein